jgi:hypothetical protein
MRENNSLVHHLPSLRYAAVSNQKGPEGPFSFLDSMIEFHVSSEQSSKRSSPIGTATRSLSVNATRLRDAEIADRRPIDKT